MSITNALANVAVKDLRSTAQWYEKLFGRPPDSMPMSELTERKFEEGGWLQVYQSQERAGTISVTLAVSDFEQQIDVLKKSRINTGAPTASLSRRLLTVSGAIM